MSSAGTADEEQSDCSTQSRKGQECKDGEPVSEADKSMTGEEPSDVSELDNASTALHSPDSLLLAQCRRRPPPIHSVCLRSGKRFNREFRTTPQETMHRMILQNVVQLNPRGRACCFKHLGLVALQRATCELVARGCDKPLQPYDSWQCRTCYALNDIDDGDEDLQQVCSVCMSEEHLTGN